MVDSDDHHGPHSSLRDSFNAAAAVAVHSRVLPSIWLVPIPPCPINPRV